MNGDFTEIECGKCGGLFLSRTADLWATLTCSGGHELHAIDDLLPNLGADEWLTWRLINDLDPEDGQVWVLGYVTEDSTTE